MYDEDKNHKKSEEVKAPNLVERTLLFLIIFMSVFCLFNLFSHEKMVEEKADSYAAEKYWTSSDDDWREKVEEYVKTINEKKLYYDSTVVAQLDVKAPNDNTAKYTCPITDDRKCDMRKINDDNLIIFIPQEGENGAERWLFVYSKNDDGKLKVTAMDYNKW